MMVNICYLCQVIIVKFMSSQAHFSAAIADLLYENEQVHLPGLGAFVLQYKPAFTDAVQGQVQPPSREIQFNPNLVIDDGVLSAYLQQKLGLEPAQAQAEVQAFIAQMKATLEKKEIVELAGIGRFYLDYENKLRFLTDSGNYDKNSFGLPAIQAYPVIRQATSSAPPKVEDKATTQANAASTAVFSWPDLWQRYSGWLTGLAIVVLLVIIYAIWPTAEPGPTSDNTAVDSTEEQLPPERLNVSPSEQLGDTEASLEEQPASAEEENASEPEIIADDDDSSAPTLSPNQRSAVIAIGLFGNVDNASRLTRRISQAGFEPYSVQEGKMMRVGIQLAYKTDSELKKNLRDIKQRFGDGAFILIQDGKRLR